MRGGSDARGTVKTETEMRAATTAAARNAATAAATATAAAMADRVAEMPDPGAVADRVAALPDPGAVADRVAAVPDPPKACWEGSSQKPASDAAACPAFPIEVTIRISVFSIASVEDNCECFHARFACHMEWVDPLYAGDAMYCNHAHISDEPVHNFPDVQPSMHGIPIYTGNRPRWTPELKFLDTRGTPAVLHEYFKTYNQGADPRQRVGELRRRCESVGGLLR